MSNAVSKRQVELAREVFAAELVFRMSKQAELTEKIKTAVGEDLKDKLRRARFCTERARIGQSIADLKRMLRTLESLANAQAGKRRARSAIRREARKSELVQIELPFTGFGSGEVN